MRRRRSALLERIEERRESVEWVRKWGLRMSNRLISYYGPVTWDVLFVALRPQAPYRRGGIRWLWKGRLL